MTRLTSSIAAGVLAACAIPAAMAQSPALGKATRFPHGTFISEPARLDGRTSSVVQGQADFEKLAGFSPTDPLYKLSEKIAYLETADGFVCSGFLVGPDLVLTNHHCAFDDQNRQRPPENLYFVFDYYEEIDQVELVTKPVALLEADEALDFALFRLNAPIGQLLGWLQLESDGNAIRSAETVKIIQHPAGRSKEIARVNTDVVANPDRRVLHYVADTEGGSSGSPVFDVTGERVIALHHAGSAVDRVNEGISMDVILPRIDPYLAAVPASPPVSRSPAPPPARAPEPPAAPADPTPPVAAPAAATATAAPTAPAAPPPQRTCTLTDKLREVEGCR